MIAPMEPGDLLAMTSMKITRGFKKGGGPWMDLTFRAPRGKRFVVLFLGAEPDDGSDPADPDHRLKALGWRPPLDPA